MWQLRQSDIQHRKLHIDAECLQRCFRDKSTTVAITKFVRRRNKAHNNYTENHVGKQPTYPSATDQNVESHSSICFPILQRMLAPREHKISKELEMFKDK